MLEVDEPIVPITSKNEEKIELTMYFGGNWYINVHQPLPTASNVNNVNSLISKISNILSKSTYFTKKANKYDRYSAIKKNPNYKYDVYSIKILISIIVLWYIL